MKRILLLTAAIILGTAAIAQQRNPGVNFIENWDTNGDGQVTFAEASERRSDIFATFDEEDDGVLSASDYAMFEDARSNQHDAMKEAGQGRRRGQGHNDQGMTMAFNDVNGDGQVSRDEFMSRSKDWYTQMDRNGDGILTTADFGRQ